MASADGDDGDGGAFLCRHLTVWAPERAPLAAAAASMFDELADCLLERRLAPLQEKVYGPVAAKAEILRIRQDVLERRGLDPTVPCTFIAGRAGDDLGLTGVQVWGVAPRGRMPLRVRTVRSGSVGGRLLETGEGRLLHLSAVHGELAGGDLPGDVAGQAEQMLRNVEAALGDHGFDYSQVARTWIYLTRLLDWYGEFNRVRTEFLRARGITGLAGARAFPASTGIQGTSGEGECMMDVLAVDGAGVVRRPIQDSSRQQRPIAYGSSFSRGIAVRCAGQETVFVSGTASIDGKGQTLHCWQREAQVVETLLSLAALLEDQGASLRDVVQATLFCKDRETLAAWQRVVFQLCLPALPVIPVLADVCRPELMVEIEALALVPVPHGAPRSERAARTLPLEMTR